MTKTKRSEAMALSDKSSDNAKRAKRTYTDEEKIVALLNLDANSGNINRTAIALGVPYATLAGWDADRRSGKFTNGIIQGKQEKRGDLTTKMESVLHSLVEAMAAKISQATLSQTAVAAGILIDKIRILRGQGLEPDPAMELCRLLGINRSQIPTSLELPPGRQLPPDLLAQFDSINTTAAVRDAQPQSNPPFEEPPETVDSVPRKDSVPTTLAPKLQSLPEPEKPVITCADDVLPKPKRSQISTNTVAQSTKNERNPPER